MMKKLILTILALFIVFEASRSSGLGIKEKVFIKKADFRTSMIYILSHEGNYANHPKDIGGETYCGIARNFNKDWKGWQQVDEYKRHHKINWNDSVPNIKWTVDDYYLNIWIREDFYSIVDQDLANYLLDFRINGTIGAAIIQTTLNEMGNNIPVTNNIDSLTVSVINNTPKWEFLVKLMNNRIDFYTHIVDKRHDQIIFLNHWVKRIKV